MDVLRKLYQRISEDSSALVGSFQEGMDKVFKERYIFFTSELTPSFLIRENCSYTWLPDKYFSGFGYMVQSLRIYLFAFLILYFTY